MSELGYAGKVAGVEGAGVDSGERQVVQLTVVPSKTRAVEH